MIKSLYIGATGMSSQQVNVDNIANNLANVNTTGFKKGVVNFEDLIYQNLNTPGANTSSSTTLPSSMQIGLGSRVASIVKSQEQGSLNSTPGIEMNVALDGRGFFQVTLPNGDIAYTRDGALQLNKDGEIVNSMGYIVSPGIIIPDNATAVTVTSDGKVQATVNSVLQLLGQFEMARFINPAGLQAYGGNMMLATDASGDAITGFAADDGFGLIKQFFLENSNVNSVTELTDLIKGQRAFEFNSKVVQAADQMLKTTVDTKA